MTAETEAQIKLASLEQLVGALKDFKAPRMIDDAVLADLSGDKLVPWVQTLETGNPAIRAALQAFEAADAEVRKQLAGHQLTLDLVGTYGKNSQAIGGFPGQAGYDIKQNSIGLQLNIPIYSGGTQSAKVVEAVAMREKARLDIEAARRAASLAAKQAWFGWQAAYVRAQAGRQAVTAAQAALRAARMGRDQGLKMELDVLQAEQQLRAAERDLRKGRYDQVAAHVKLKAVAGRLTVGDVAALDRLFVAFGEEARGPLPSIPPADPVRDLRARAMQVSTQ
jgi:outer membrane protein